MSHFDAAYLLTMTHEGGYVDHPNDKGGETYAGVSRKWHPTWPGWAIIDQFKKETGFPKNLLFSKELLQLKKAFYKKEFWDVLQLDKVRDKDIAIELFDSAVNAGPGAVARWWQEALNLCNQNEKVRKNITVDGRIGTATLDKTNTFSGRDARVLHGVLNLLQGEHYLKLCRKDNTQEVFLHGWVLNRIKVNP